MPADRAQLRRRLQGLRRRQRQGKPVDRGMAALERDLIAAQARLERRRTALPRPSYPEELPVSAKREDIMATIRDHQVVVVAGETGSGKTTQLPKICLELGRGVAGQIGHTQPRRIAARSVAARIAAELNSEPGRLVGYKVRFQDHASPDSYIKLMTDGILLAEMQGDRDLLAYDTLIIDEAHERSLNIDFLMGYLKQLLPRRPDLKLIITSATIDTERFARHFGGAPIVEVSGRTYPVELRYRPLGGDDDDDQERDLQQGIVDAVDELARLGAGDTLVFLPGEREIRETAEALRKHHPPATEILPLFARLSVSEQNKVFQPHGRRRIVLATNVAETSLTVPGIRYVVDAGVARISRYSYHSKVQRLPIEKVSRSSADQRKGRCGRVGPGVCIRLYDEDDYLARPEFTEPEILRTNLAAVILQMKTLGLGDIEDFPFVEAPDTRYINDGYRLLFELGAVDARRGLTSLGRDMARLPLDPRIARMIFAAREQQCLHEVLVIAAALSVQDPRERPLDRQQQADAAHGEFKDERSDFLAYVNLWDGYHAQARHLSGNKLRRWCREHFLAYLRMRDWHDVHQQLANVVKDMGWRINQEPGSYDAVHRALLAGLLGNVGLRGEEREYAGSHGKKFHIFPGSGLAKKGPKWIMAAELVETARVFARTVAEIQPAWVEQAAAHLVKRHHSDPHWERRAARVAAFESVTLYGLTLVQRRRVNYGPIAPTESRELFIRRALVEGDYDTRAEFFHHNRGLLQEVQDMEDKVRRRDLLVDEETLFAFYDGLVPDGIYDGPRFERWRRDAEAAESKLLYLTRDKLLREGADTGALEQFPDHLQLDGLVLPLEYRFEPGHAADGVTAVVPLAGLNQLAPEPLEWLVPGLLRDRLVALIKGLPKALRRNFVPAPDFADACLQVLEAGKGALPQALAAQLKRMTGVTVPDEAWRPEQLPAHLRMNLRVVDERGKVLAEGRELPDLQAQLGGRARRSFAAQPEGEWGRAQVDTWDFGDLPEAVEMRRGGATLRGFPGLAADGDQVALRLFDTRDKAAAAHRDGLCRLFMRRHRKEVQYLRRNLPGIQQMCLYYAPMGACEALKDDLVLAAVSQALDLDRDIRGADEFERRSEDACARLVSVGNELCQRTGALLAEYHQVAKRLRGSVPPAWLEAGADIRDQLQWLVYPGFLRLVPAAALAHYPRYLKAVQRRLERLAQQPGRDRQTRLEIEPLWRAWRERAGDPPGPLPDALAEFHWLLEELRVSLFAQELGTAAKVSVKRLGEQWKALATG